MFPPLLKPPKSTIRTARGNDLIHQIEHTASNELTECNEPTTTESWRIKANQSKTSRKNPERANSGIAHKIPLSPTKVCLQPLSFLVPPARSISPHSNFGTKEPNPTKSNQIKANSSRHSSGAKPDPTKSNQFKLVTRSFDRIHIQSADTLPFPDFMIAALAPLPLKVSSS
jgi:hypothetical protein